MRRPLLPFSVLACCALLAPDALAADGDRLLLTPPALIHDLVVEEQKLAQGYDDAYDESYDEPEEEDPPPRRRRRRRSSSGGSSSSSSSSSGGGSTGSTSSSSGGGADYAFGDASGGGVTPMGKQIGIGIQVGAPTALTAKIMLAPDQGIVAGLGAGYGFFFAPTLSLHVDYVWHPMILTQSDAFALSWYVGGGAWLGLWDGNRRGYVVAPFYTYVFVSPIALALRVPIGVSLAMKSIPLEFYGEAAPALGIFPGITFGLGFTLGARFYF